MARKTSSKKAAATRKKSSTAKRSTAKRSTSKKSASKKSTAKKSTARKSPVKAVTGTVEAVASKAKKATTGAKKNAKNATTGAKKLGAIMEVAGAVLQTGATLAEQALNRPRAKAGSSGRKKRSSE